MPLSGESISDDNSNSVFLDNDVLQQVYLVITDATVRVTFVTPYIRLWEHLKTKIEDSINKEVDITFVLRDFANEKFPTKHPPEDLRWLKDHGVKVVKVPNLHSKIYLNERTVLISSMNITEPSIANSRDFAMIVKVEEDVKMFREYVSHLIEKFGPMTRVQPTGDQAVKYASSLIRKFGSMRPELSAGPQIVRDRRKSGTCIRCGQSMAFNKQRPLCENCYRKWARFKNDDFRENHCHSCGKLTETTYARPLCLACYRRETT